MGVAWMGGPGMPKTIDAAKQYLESYLGAGYTSRPLADYYNPNAGEQKGSNAEIEQKAAIVRQAYENWRAANASKPGALYTTEEQKKFLPKGFQIPKWDYEQTHAAQIDQYGNIIGTQNIGWQSLNQALATFKPKPDPLSSMPGLPPLSMMGGVATDSAGNRTYLGRATSTAGPVGYGFTPDSPQTSLSNTYQPSGSASQSWYKYPTGGWSNQAPSAGATPDYTGTSEGLSEFLMNSGKSSTPGTSTKSAGATYQPPSMNYSVPNSPLNIKSITQTQY